MQSMISKMGVCSFSKLLFSSAYFLLALPLLHKPHTLGFVFILMALLGIISTLISYQHSFLTLKKYSISPFPLKKRTEHMVYCSVSCLLCILLGTHPAAPEGLLLFALLALLLFIFSIFIARLDLSEESF